MWWGPGWGPWKLIHGALGHTTDTGGGWVGVGVAQAWQCGEGERRGQRGPSQELLEVVGWGVGVGVGGVSGRRGWKESVRGG